MIQNVQHMQEKSFDFISGTINTIRMKISFTNQIIDKSQNIKIKSVEQMTEKSVEQMTEKKEFMWVKFCCTYELFPLLNIFI